MRLRRIRNGRVRLVHEGNIPRANAKLSVSVEKKLFSTSLELSSCYWFVAKCSEFTIEFLRFLIPVAAVCLFVRIDYLGSSVAVEFYHSSLFFVSMMVALMSKGGYSIADFGSD